MDSSRGIDALLAEQVAYYRAAAPKYLETGIPEIPEAELADAADALKDELDTFRPTGDVLELACGPGTWTAQLLAHADRVTALDSAPEMLRIAAARIGDNRVRFVQADALTWEPDWPYDAVFFGFWLSHVPLERFEAFWSLVERCLKPGGRVAFADDAFRTPDELIEGEESEVIRRQLIDGEEFRAVKVPHTPESLEHRLRALGWEIEVHYVGGPFFWGAGARATGAGEGV